MTTAYDTAILAEPTLVSRYTLDETSGTTATDSVGSNNLTYAGSYTLAQTRVAANTSGTSVQFAISSNGKATSGTSFSGTTNRTFICWFNSTNATAVRQCLFFNGSGSNGYGVFINGQGVDHQFSVLFQGVVWFGTGAAVPGGDNCIALVMNGSGNALLYLNGELVYTSSGSSAAAPSGGFGIASEGSIGQFDGTIDDLSVFSSALSSGHIAYLYTLGNFTGPVLIDGFGYAAPSGGSSQSVTLTTSLTNDIIVLGIYQENGSFGATIQTVTSVSGGSLTWAQRAGYSRTNNNAGRLEVWWALAASPLSAVTITVTLSGTTSQWGIIAFAANGPTTGAPFDANVSLPGTADPTTANGTSPVCSSLSTSSATDLLFALYGAQSPSLAGIRATPTGFTLLSYGSGFRASIGFKSVTSTQSGVTVTWGGNGGDVAPMMIVDALTASTPAVNTFMWYADTAMAGNFCDHAMGL